MFRPEWDLLASEDSRQLPSLQLPHTHEASGGHTHLLEARQRQNLREQREHLII